MSDQDIAAALGLSMEELEKQVIEAVLTRRYDRCLSPWAFDNWPYLSVQQNIHLNMCASCQSLLSSLLSNNLAIYLRYNYFRKNTWIGCIK